MDFYMSGRTDKSPASLDVAMMADTGTFTLCHTSEFVVIHGGQNDLRRFTPLLKRLLSHLSLQKEPLPLEIALVPRHIAPSSNLLHLTIKTVSPSPLIVPTSKHLRSFCRPRRKFSLCERYLIQEQHRSGQQHFDAGLSLYLL